MCAYEEVTMTRDGSSGCAAAARRGVNLRGALLADRHGSYD